MAITKLLSPTPVQNQEKARPIRLLWHFRRRQDFAFSLWEGPCFGEASLAGRFGWYHFKKVQVGLSLPDAIRRRRPPLAKTAMSRYDGLAARLCRALEMHSEEVTNLLHAGCKLEGVHRRRTLLRAAR